MSDKKDFTARARQQLEDWDYQLDRLSARLNDLRDEWRDEAREKLNEMKGRRSEFEEKLERLESHGDDAWDDIKAGLKVGLILVLAEHGYPPVDRDEVYKEIFEQAENFKKYQSLGG